MLSSRTLCEATAPILYGRNTFKFDQNPSVYRKPKGGNDKDGMGQDEERFFDYLPLSALFAGTAEGASFQARIAHAEFYKVRSIKDHARECLALRRAEAAWNAKVLTTVPGARDTEEQHSRWHSPATARTCLS